MLLQPVEFPVIFLNARTSRYSKHQVRPVAAHLLRVPDLGLFGCFQTILRSL